MIRPSLLLPAILSIFPAISGCCNHLDHRAGLYKGGYAKDDIVATFESSYQGLEMENCKLIADAYNKSFADPKGTPKLDCAPID